MKKSLLALAVLGAFAGAASAQSSVTMYGLIDLGVGKPIGTAAKGMFQAAGSRLGMRGSEDLGGGLKGIFNIETRFDADTGSAQVITGASDSRSPLAAGSFNRFWSARSFVGLEGGFGQVVLGREYTPAFLQAQNGPDIWGWDTVVSSKTVPLTQGGIGTNKIRNDSSLTYRISFGGVNVGVQVAERTDAIVNVPKRPMSLAVSYGGGPLGVGFGHEITGLANEKWTSLFASYAFGPVKPTLFYGKGTLANNRSIKSLMGSVAWTIGAGEMRAMVGRHQTAGTTDISALGLGYHHSLSKRTKLYADFVRDSKVPTQKTGYDLGIQHKF